MRDRSAFKPMAYGAPIILAALTILATLFFLAAERAALRSHSSTDREAS